MITVNIIAFLFCFGSFILMIMALFGIAVLIEDLPKLVINIIIVTSIVIGLLLLSLLYYFLFRLIKKILGVDEKDILDGA